MKRRGTVQYTSQRVWKWGEQLGGTHGACNLRVEKSNIKISAGFLKLLNSLSPQTAPRLPKYGVRMCEPGYIAGQGDLKSHAVIYGHTIAVCGARPQKNACSLRALIEGDSWPPPRVIHDLEVLMHRAHLLGVRFGLHEVSSEASGKGSSTPCCAQPLVFWLDLGFLRFRTYRVYRAYRVNIYMSI